MSEPIGNTEQLAEPVAVKYDFDEYGRVKDYEFLYTHPISEPIGNPEQLPVAWIEHHKGGDNLNWEEVNHPYAKATPLYIHPMRELSDEEIMIIHDATNTNNWVIDFARAIIKASQGDK